MEIISIIPSNHYKNDLNFHYLHGDIENFAGYDCFYPSKIPENDGLYTSMVQILRPDNKVETRHGFWFRWSDNVGRLLGLVLENSDTKEIEFEFAMKKFLAKPFAI